MKYKIYLYLNEHNRDGFDLSIVNEEQAKYWNNELNRFIQDIDIDLAPHTQWIAEKSVKVADQLREQAKMEFERKERLIKEFESKFLLLQTDHVLAQE